MMNRGDVTSVMVEFHRFGGEEDILKKGAPYIRTTSGSRPACEIRLGLGHREFMKHFDALRYGHAGAGAEAALGAFEEESRAMLHDLPPQPEGLVQIDLVTAAAELWAFPFEAYARDKPGVVVTRRIRGEFGRHAPWPAVPKVLFAHAAIGKDLTQDLVDEHVAALHQALRPWTGGAEPSKELLEVKELYSLANLQKAREGGFTHIHLLAHGTPVSPLDGAPFEDWGMRLGPPKSPGVHPSLIANALAPQDGFPVTITIASCDSANQASSAFGSYSVAHELHRRGVAVVVASQLPLTVHGSVLLTKHFYEPLLRGDDVRHALYDVREALRNDAQAGHDWLSVVAYVRIPETYDEHLDKVALRMELAMLRAAQKRADQVIAGNDRDALKDVEPRVRERIASLDVRRRGLEKKDEKDRLECQGLLASAYKRLAELLFLAGRDPAEQRQALETSLQHYSAAFTSNLNAHWQGVQQLALQAVLHHEIDREEYGIVRRVARRDVQNKDDHWGHGTLAELLLLAEFAGETPDLNAARDAVRLFRNHAKTTPTDIDSTWRQLRRYVDWWTPANGFRTDLGAAAADLAKELV